MVYTVKVHLQRTVADLAPHATLLARLPPQQSNLSRHRTWGSTVVGRFNARLRRDELPG